MKFLQFIIFNIQKIAVVNEKKKINKSDGQPEDICQHLLSFGRCLKVPKCPWRHAFINSDQAAGIPTEGLIHFRIKQVITPTNFVIEILKFYNTNTKKMVSREGEIDDINEMLQEIQNMKREFKTDIQVNDICAVELKGRVHRCKILRTNSSNEKKMVEIFLLDEGLIHVVKSSEILKLPIKFELLSSLVTQLRILNVVTTENEDYWDAEATNEIKRALKSIGNDSDYATCNIKFSIKDTIFTENFEILKTDDFTDNTFVCFNLENHYIKKQLCEFDKTMMENFKQLLKDTVIQWNDKVTPAITPKPTETPSKPTLAELSINETYRAKMRFLVSPDQFFVTVERPDQHDVNAKMQQIRNFNNLVPLRNFKIGSFCLYKNDRQGCQRARITGIFGDEYELLLVDEGHYTEVSVADQIFHCPGELIELLPMQAFKCRLVGIAPKSGDTWNSKVSDAVKNFLTETFGRDSFNMKVVNIAGDHHEVILHHPETNRRIDEIIVKMKLAEAKQVEDIDTRRDALHKNLMQIAEQRNERTADELLDDLLSHISVDSADGITNDALVGMFLAPAEAEETEDYETQRIPEVEELPVENKQDKIEAVSDAEDDDFQSFCSSSDESFTHGNRNNSNRYDAIDDVEL